MKKKNWLLVIIILIAALLIAMVFWIYAKRIENIEGKMKMSPISIPTRFMLPIRDRVRYKIIYSFLDDPSPDKVKYVRNYIYTSGGISILSRSNTFLLEIPLLLTGT